MHPGYSVGRCHPINKAVFHTRAETMPDLTGHIHICEDTSVLNVDAEVIAIKTIDTHASTYKNGLKISVR